MNEVLAAVSWKARCGNNNNERGPRSCVLKGTLRFVYKLYIKSNEIVKYFYNIHL